MFKNNKDILPVFIILSTSIVDFWVFFTQSVDFCQIYFLIMIVPKCYYSAWNHNHHHNYTFRSPFLNRILEFFYALHTGISSQAWVLQHNLGHHTHYLDQKKDPSRWQHEDGSTMSALYYTIRTFLMAYPYCFTIGKKHVSILNRFYFNGIILMCFLAFAFKHNQINFFWIFLLPMLISIFATCYVTYYHHSDMSLTIKMQSCRNNFSKINNILTGNLGYHTAHHYNMSLHWSKLPGLHEYIFAKPETEEMENERTNKT